MGHITFLTGPVRSGKSNRAVSIASAWGIDNVFVATYRSDPTDAEMMERLRRHREERPAWRTLEAPSDIGTSLAALSPTPGGAIIDCLTLWASDRFSHTDREVIDEWQWLLERLRSAAWPTVIVSNELGWSLVPPDPAARRFRDLAGTLAQRTSAAADEAYLMVAGCSVRLK